MKHEEAVQTLAAERYILGELADAERDRFEEHFFECAECAHDIRALSHLKEGTHAVFEATPATVKAKTPSPRSWTQKWEFEWFRPGLVFATIGALAVTVSFTSWQNVQLRRQAGPQSVASVMLRPETRGEASRVDVSRTGGFVLLEADLPGASGELKWEVRPFGEGNIVGEGSGLSPAAGASFKVLLPADVLTAGSYEMTVRTADQAKTWVFRFTAGRT